MQGIYIDNDAGGGRCPTKKALKAAIIADPESVILEATSMFGNEYGGPLTVAPAGEYYVVGPDPYTSRKWYATISVADSTPKVTIK